jgi:uncharacterized protein
MRGCAYEWIRSLCFCVCAAAACACGAAAPSPIPQPSSLLVDEAGALSDAEREALLARLRAIQDSGRAQVAILVAKGTDGAPLADYALRVAESWQLGRAGRDDGLLVLVVPSPAAARLEVGYGLEGVIPDARASQWLDELVPSVKNKEIAQGLDRLLDRIEGVLPKTVEKATASGDNYLFPDHPEWRLPFVLAVFSPFALFPMFIGRWGSVASAVLLAAFLGGAAGSLWSSTSAAFAVAGVAFPLPLLWGLNWWDSGRLGPWLRHAKTFGNLAAVAMFFAVITLFVGVGLWTDAADFVWAAPMFAGLLAIGLAVFLFPGKPAHYLMLVLRSAMHFAFIAVVAYVALEPFIPHPGRTALAVAAAVTLCAALALYLDSRESARADPSQGMRWSLWFVGLALLITLPFGLLALLLAVGGEDFQTRIVQAAAGGGSIAGVLALAARVGLIAAVKIGLGGRFGGGGAGRSE